MHSLFSFGIACGALLLALWAWLAAYWAVRYVQSENEASLSLKKLTEIETELTEHADSIHSLHTSLHKLRSRIGMREHAEKKRQNGGDVPDSRTDPAGYKQAMRLKLKQEGVLK